MQATDSIARLTGLMVGMVCVCLAQAATSDDEFAELQRLDKQVQVVKREALSLNSELRLLEEDLLYPDEQQTSIYVSMNITSFDLESVTLSVDGTELAHHDYSAREVYALRRGGFHRLYIGNLAPGPRRLQAVFSGRFVKDPADSPPYTRNMEITFQKSSQAKDLELKISRNRRRDLVLGVYEKDRSQ